MGRIKKSNIKKYILGPWTLAAVLLLCVMATSTAAAAGIWLLSAEKEPDTVISVMPPEKKVAALQNVFNSSYVYTAAVTAPSVAHNSNSRVPAATANTASFYIDDEETTWNNSNNVDIFRATYEDGNGVIIASGKNGNKIVAPGTSNNYLFHLTNEGDAAIDYELKLAATVSAGFKEYTVPVKVRLSDGNGTWLCGSAEELAPFQALNGTNQNAVLGKNSYCAYTLEWEWPYESGNDELDTLLGNLAEDEELVLTIEINITAEYAEDPDTSGGSAPMGDSSRADVWVIIMIVSFICFLLVVALGRRERKRSEV